jgi:hypothetical protein
LGDFFTNTSGHPSSSLHFLLRKQTLKGKFYEFLKRTLMLNDKKFDSGDLYHQSGVNVNDASR